MVRRRRYETGINYKKRIPKIVVINQTDEEKNIYNKICSLLKEKYFACSCREINARLILFALLPKITSSSKSAMESLERIANDEKYHRKTRNFANEILQDYKELKKDSKMEKLIEIIDKTLKEDPKAKILIYTKHPITLKYMIEKIPKNIKITEFMGGKRHEYLQFCNKRHNGRISS